MPQATAILIIREMLVRGQLVKEKGGNIHVTGKVICNKVGVVVVYSSVF